MSEAAGYGAGYSWPAQQAIFLLSTHPPSTYSQVGAMERASSTTATAADTPSAAYATPVLCTATPVITATTTTASSSSQSRRPDSSWQTTAAAQ